LSLINVNVVSEGGAGKAERAEECEREQQRHHRVEGLARIVRALSIGPESAWGARLTHSASLALDDLCPSRLWIALREA
jgi:hypothetical protein